MNLLDILTHSLDKWPYDELTYATQDFGGNIWFSKASPATADDGDGVYWTSPGLRVLLPLDCCYNGRKADDHFYAIVTLEQWVEERNKRNAAPLTSTTHSHKAKPFQPKPISLTRRETEILQLVRQGFTNQEIAESLFIARYTVETHIRNTYKKLAASSRTRAVNEAQLLGLLP